MSEGSFVIKIFRERGAMITCTRVKDGLYKATCKGCDWEYTSKWDFVVEEYTTHRCS